MFYGKRYNGVLRLWVKVVSMDEMMASIAESIADMLHVDIVIGEFIVAGIVFILALLIGWIVYHIFERYFTKWATKTKTTLDDAILANIKKPIYLIVTLAGIFFAISTLSILQPYSFYLSVGFTVIEILIITFIVTRVINVLIAWYADRSTEKQKMSKHLLFLMRKILHAIAYLFAFLFILNAFHIDLSGALVGLGVAGIAIGLALQTILGDVFSAFTIFFDKPFEIGDFIIIGEDAGVVKKIGIQSTRIQTLQGEELVVSNNELVSTRIHNFKKMDRRRIQFTFGVIYGTPLNKLKKIPSMVRNIIDDVELAETDRVHFKKFGDFSLNFEVVYYISTSDYTQYMAIQQEINFGIKKAFEEEGIEMAFPTQTIHLNKP